MYGRLISKSLSASGILLSLGLFLLAGCGTNTSSTSSSTSSSATAATATACAQSPGISSSFKTVSGTLKSISGSTLSIASTQGSDATVTYSSTTRFTQESLVPATALQDGTSVIVLVNSSNNTYTATSITVSAATSAFPRANGTPGSGGFGGGFGGRGNNPCFSRGRAGTPRTGTGTGNFRGLTGKVSQVSGNIMTITDTTGTDYSVTITPQTKIQDTKTTTAKALKVGTLLTVTGTADSQGNVAARQVAILLSLPSGPPSQ